MRERAADLAARLAVPDMDRSRGPGDGQEPSARVEGVAVGAEAQRHAAVEVPESGSWTRSVLRRTGIGHPAAVRAEHAVFRRVAPAECGLGRTVVKQAGRAADRPPGLERALFQWAR